MVSAVTHLRRSLHPLPGREGKPKRDVAIVSWYNQRLHTWQASSPDFPYLADARATAMAALSPTRKIAVSALLCRIESALRSICRHASPARPNRGATRAPNGCNLEGTLDARYV